MDIEVTASASIASERPRWGLPACLEVIPCNRRQSQYPKSLAHATTKGNETHKNSSADFVNDTAIQLGFRCENAMASTPLPLFIPVSDHTVVATRSRRLASLTALP